MGECDRDKGENKHAEADIQCVAAATQSSMHPGHFVAFLAALITSMLMCIGGCLCGKSNAPKSEVRQRQVDLRSSLPLFTQAKPVPGQSAIIRNCPNASLNGERVICETYNADLDEWLV